MTEKRQKKVKRYRGERTHGGGSQKKRRGSGNRGGYGNAGTGKRADHRKFTVLKKFGLSYFGKRGFHRKNTVEVKSINICDLPENQKLDLGSLGYKKLLGKGSPKLKYEITVDTCSEKAKQKIEANGGKVTVLSTPSESSEE
ncbi:50S ribosomal protein L15 [Candidatus Woesearchaeota archaeon]|jgi:large subunit ribosomal protein L15|nr:50S ribosomal protein L15 [Candidatus Woesearchaeota archaeon]MBT3438870.1 50S ribosomal protein L15 [Candidatus Woesearchaeota archaeon]MBT4058130.1 50S ribosomal protein L15 [Candidatus Woesearchaeota archaeon]MBT4208959.1 50S ribosomal protein L15 [Candidatus Woesearchaeota archaeon]MBT4732454.1 50S ribosomal protein L15 [Candidatus Woesearchaeota archaeon]